MITKYYSLVECGEFNTAGSVYGAFIVGYKKANGTFDEKVWDETGAKEAFYKWVREELL